LSKIFVDTIEPKTSGGAVNLKPCTFAMTSNTAQSLPNSSQTTITFDRTMHDSHSIVDLANNKIVITAATEGIWFIQAHGTSDKTITEYNRNGDTTGGNPATVASYLGLLESGDSVYVTAYHTYGSARNTVGSSGTSQNYNFLRGFRIGQL